MVRLASKSTVTMVRLASKSTVTMVRLACKSTVTTLSAPALVIKFETNFADIDVLGETFLSCLAYPK